MFGFVLGLCSIQIILLAYSGYQVSRLLHLRKESDEQSERLLKLSQDLFQIIEYQNASINSPDIRSSTDSLHPH